MANRSPTELWVLTDEERAKVEEVRARSIARHRLRIGPQHDHVRSTEVTPREVDILEMLALGLDNNEIADALFISRETVKSHQRNLRTKLDARSRTHLVVIAIRRGLIQ